MLHDPINKEKLMQISTINKEELRQIHRADPTHKRTPWEDDARFQTA